LVFTIAWALVLAGDAGMASDFSDPVGSNDL
jgi:hypothetical protein